MGGKSRKTFRPPSPDDLQLWCKECSASDILAFEAIAGDAMDAVGQQRRFVGLSSILLIPWRLKHRLTEVFLDLKGKVAPPPSGEKIHTGPLVCKEE